MEREKIEEEYPDGYSVTWREQELKHYIEKYKEHEANRVSTSEREKYWKNYEISFRSKRAKNFQTN